MCVCVCVCVCVCALVCAACVKEGGERKKERRSKQGGESSRGPSTTYVGLESFSQAAHTPDANATPVSNSRHMCGWVGGWVWVCV